ncbi:cutinase family protein [Aeromicrobium sp. SMF47]|nr:cutinase family protein [Aeromicrobium yanjiei]
MEHLRGVRRHGGRGVRPGSDRGGESAHDQAGRDRLPPAVRTQAHVAVPGGRAALGARAGRHGRSRPGPGPRAVTRRLPQLAATAVATLLLGSCGTGPTAGSGTSGDRTLLVDETCADLVVVGARGSTQDPDRNLGVGTEVRVTVEELAKLLHRRSDTTVRVDPIRYDSSQTATLAAYQRQVAEGSQLMIRRLEKLERRCPDSRFALVGFSEGAQVVHATAADMPAAVAERVSLVAMMADPRQNPTDAITRYGYASEPVTGSGRLGSGSPIDPDLRRAAISLCVEGDEICNDEGAPGGPPSATHRTFYEKSSTAKVTAKQLDRVLRRNGV